MSNGSLLGAIKEFVVGQGFEILAEDTAHNEDFFEEESFAIGDASGRRYFVSVSAI